MRFKIDENLPFEVAALLRTADEGKASGYAARKTTLENLTTGDNSIQFVNRADL